MTTKDHVPVFLLISYCALCNDYGVLQEHEQYEDNSVWKLFKHVDEQ